MKASKISRWFAAGLAASILSSVPAQADTPAFLLGHVINTRPSSFTGTRGWQFGIGTTNTIIITQLGVFDDGGDGLVNPHQVGLWRLDGTLLASTTVPAGTEAPLVDGYRYVQITPVVIPFTGQSPGHFTIAAHYSVGDDDDLVTPSPFDPKTGGLLMTGGVAPVPLYGRFGLGPGLPFPGGITQPPFEGGVAERFFEPNLQYVIVPEPSTWLLLSAGVFCLRFGHCKFRAQR